MVENIKALANRVSSLAEEVRVYKEYKERFKVSLEELEKRKKELDAGEYEALKEKFLKGKNKEEILKAYNSHILKLLDSIEELNQKIMSQFVDVKKAAKVEGVDVDYIKKIVSAGKRRKEVTKILVDYSVYKPNKYGEISNTILGGVSDQIIKKYPGFFKGLYNSLISANVKVLSRTYVSMMLLSSILGFVVVILLSLLFLSTDNLLRYILTSFIFGVFGCLIVFGLFYFNPSFTVKSLRRKMRSELPFVAIHMAAVAGSGAQPIAMFNLILKSGEYKALEKEIKKIVNYVNLFGYDLTTALKMVANTTPSKEFKGLLDGVTSTIETGGSLKSYLAEKSKDIMDDYKLVRKKYVDTLSTYSDIYTGILIAAPLLFFVTLAIIQSVGGAIGGVSVNTLALIGTFIVIPLMNIGFLIFLGVIQPK